MKTNVTGSYELLSFTIEKNNQCKPWRNNIDGLLIYTDNSKMSVFINSDLQGGEPSEILRSVLFYSGNYEIKGSSIFHYVRNATNLSRLGQTMKRSFTLKNNILELFLRNHVFS